MSRILPITLVSPGRRGLNKERSNDLLGPEWAIEAINCVLNREGRLAARKGWTNQTTNAISGTPSIEVLFEYLKNDGTSTIITTADDKIYTGITDYTDSANDVTPASTPTANAWQFVNFHDKVIGVQASHNPISYAGSGDFADITAASGSIPTGNAALSAFGRLWIASSDGQSIGYSALLDETKWANADGGGTIDLSNVWTRGVDSIVALAAFGAGLVVFGRNHIILYADNAGSTLGVDPDNLYVSDTIEGTGCVARDSVQPIGEGDLAFLSRHGIQLLGRVILQKSNPTTTISKNIRTYLNGVLSTQTVSGIRSAASPENGLYMLLFPDSGRVIVADTRFGFEDEDGQWVLPMLEWIYQTTPGALCVKTNGDVLLGFDGRVGKYSGNLDNADTYTVTFSSPWLRLDPEIEAALKILKEIPTIVQLSASANVAWTWEFDFNGSVFSGVTSYVLDSTAAEWSIGEYNVSEYSGGLTLQSRTLDGQGEGQFFRIGNNITINGFDFALQQVKLIFKLGRTA